MLNKPVEDKGEPKIGDLIAYYLEGWRYGYLEELKGGRAKVRPIGTYKANSLPHCVWRELTEIKKA